MSTAASAMGDHEILLRHDDDNGITTLTLNRPNQYNALSEAMLDALQTALDDIAGDERVRVVILAGAGKAFCAGHDLKEMRTHSDKAYQKALFERCSRVMLSLVRLPQPVIARVHGTATAAGCQLVATCDLAVASTQARLAVSGINVGLFCSTPAVALTRNIERKQAMEMLMTGEFIDAHTALARGLVNRVAEPDALDDTIRAVSDSILAKSAAAVAIGKRMFYKQLEMGLSDAYDYAAEVMACNMMSDDAQEGIDAFMQKRKPEWRHR